MKHVLIAAALVLTTMPMGPAAFAQQQQQQQRSHEDARKIFEEAATVWMNTFVKHDAKAIAALFLPDAAFLPLDGSPVVKGREALERQWAQLFENIGGREQLTVRDVIPAGDDAIVGLIDWAITADKGANAGKIFRGRTANTVVKTPDGWKLAVIAPQRAPEAAAGSSTPK